jgi:hypothetical protein
MLVASAQAQDLVKTGIGFNVVQGTSRYIQIDKPADNISFTILDTGTTYTDTLRVWAIFLDNPEQYVRLSAVNQFTRVSDSLLVAVPGSSATFYVNTGGAKNFIVENANKQSVSGRRSIVVYNPVTVLNPVLKKDSAAVTITNFPTSQRITQAQYDSLYALLNTLNKQNGVDTVYAINSKDTITYIDTLTINDTLRTRDVTGYKYIEALVITSAGTDSVVIERAETRLTKWIPIGVYDQYTDTKYNIISPGASVLRSYLINTPNLRKFRYRRVNLATASLSNKFIVITVCVR